MPRSRGRRARAVRRSGHGDRGAAHRAPRRAGPPAAGRHRRRAVRSGRALVRGRPGAAGQAGDGPLVLLVDDLHLLDATSATLVGQLVDADLVFLVATVRTERGDGSDASRPLWQRARVRRDRSRRTSTGPASTRCCTSCCRVRSRRARSPTSGRPAKGNVLFVRELVLGALDGGHLVPARRVAAGRPARDDGPPARAGRRPPRRTGPRGRPRRSTSWPCGSRPACRRSRRSSAASGSSCSTAVGLLAVRTDGRRQQVTLAHPLYGEILRARMPALTRRRLLLEHADRIEAYGARRREDAVRVATARLDASGSADPRSLSRRPAWPATARTSPRSSGWPGPRWLDGMTPEAGLLLGEALHELGRRGGRGGLRGGRALDRRGRRGLRGQLTEIRSEPDVGAGPRRRGARLPTGPARDRVREQAGREELASTRRCCSPTPGARRRDRRPRLGRTSDPFAPSRALRAQAEVPALVRRPVAAIRRPSRPRSPCQQLALPDQVAIPGPGCTSSTGLLR